MAKIKRCKKRIKKTAEVFTPKELVIKMLDSLDVNWDDPPKDKTFLDPTCGDGNFLEEILKKGIPLNMIYGVDLMEDNIKVVKSRLLKIAGDTSLNRKIVNENIICADALQYDYNFGRKFGLNKFIN